MEPESVKSLADEFQVDAELVKQVIEQVGDDPEKVRDTIQSLLPNYLIIKGKFMPGRAGGKGGLLFVVARRGEGSFLLFRTLVTNDLDWLEPVHMSDNPEEFFAFLKEYFSGEDSKFKLYDAEKLKQELLKKLSPSSIQYLFSCEGLQDAVPDQENQNDPDSETQAEYKEPSPMDLDSASSDPTTSFDKPIPILRSNLKEVLREILIDNVSIDVKVNYYTTSQYIEVAPILGLKTPDEEAAETADQKKKSGEDGLKVYLKGQFLIDPVKGVLAKELKVGDIAYVDILDRSETAKSVCTLFGAYRKGLWVPVRGRVTEILDSSSDRWRFRLKIAKEVFVDIISFADIKVKFTDFGLPVAGKKPAEAHQSANFLPLLIGAVLFLAVILLLVLSR